MTLLSLKNVSVSVSDRDLLRGITFSVASGEKVAIVGANGAGKSTLLKAIAGLIRGYSGSLALHEREVKTIAPEALSKLVSMVPQRLEFVPRFSVKEFLEISCCPDDTHLDATLSPLMDRYLTDLSGGELQRVILTGAVAQEASLLLLDEPTAHLDPTSRAEVEQAINKYHQEKTISYLLVTHDLLLALSAAERVLVMKDGAMLGDALATDPQLTDLLFEAYGCRFTRFSHPVTGKPVIISG